MVDEEWLRLWFSCLIAEGPHSGLTRPDRVVEMAGVISGSQVRLVNSVKAGLSAGNACCPITTDVHFQPIGNRLATSCT